MVIRTKRIIKKKSSFSNSNAVYEKAEKWFSRNTGIIASILLLSLAAFAGAFFYGRYARKRASNAFMHFNKGLLAYRHLTEKSEEFEIQNVSTLFEYVAENYSREKGGLYAQLYLGHIEYMYGKFDRAANIYNGLIQRKYNDPILLEIAKNGLAYSYLALKKYSQALDLFKQIAASDSLSSKRDAYLKMAEAYAGLNDIASTRKTLEDIIKKFPDDPENDDIKNRISLLGMNG